MRHFLSAPLLILASAATAQQSGEVSAFVTRLGNDTVALERVTRSGDRVEGVYLERAPRLTVWRYSATLKSDGTLGRFEATGRRAPNAPAAATSVIVFGSDSADVEIRTGEQTQAFKIAARPGSIPWWSSSFGLYEQATRHAASAGRDSIPFDLVVVGARAGRGNAVRRRGADTVSIDYFGQPLLARVDRAGRILGLTGRQTTMKVEVERVTDLAIDRLAEALLAREASAPTAGPLSPRDTTRGTVGTAELLVDYGRPSKRGREIFGNIVAWGEVWRTGANAATQFRTSVDLMVGNTRVPAGLYTLWTLPRPEGVELIINRQTGQWGTVYDSSQDLARIPMRVEHLNQPIERFGIRIERTPSGGTMAFEWDRTRWTIEVRAA